MGSVIGGVFVALLGYRYWRLRPKNARLTLLLVGMTMLAVALHGAELRAEQLLHRMTGSLRIACR
jgi:hypothetical protein